MSDLSKIWPEWHVEEQLGKGSFGTVYKAVRRDHNIESYAAVKVISIPADKSEIDSLRSEGLDINATKTYLQGIVNDFVSEIQLMQSLKGVQNIVSVEDYTVVEKIDEIGWDIYIRMELLTPFNTYICDKTLTEKEVIKIGCDICTALELCSKRNIIHRDIKPENMFVNDFGDFKLGDFGIARKLENMTGGLSQKGTAGYMAPEVVNSTDYDVRADIYSLGLVLYRLLNGNRLPFLRADQLLNPNERRNAVERRIRGEALPVPCNASPAMVKLILRACAFEPSQRFVSATEMKQALMSVANGTYQKEESDLYKTIPACSNSIKDDKNIPAHCMSEKGTQKSNDAIDVNKRVSKRVTLPKVTIMVLIVVLIALSIYVGRSVTNDDAKGNITEINSEIITEKEDVADSNKEEIEAIIIEAEEMAVLEDYNSALANVQAGLVMYPDSEDLQVKVEEYTMALAEEKKTTLAEAEGLSQAGDYVSAINLIKNAQNVYGDDIDYQSAYDVYSSAYKDEVITSADELLSKGDYIGAMQKIQEAEVIIGEDAELANKNEEYEDAYATNVISNVESCISEKDYDTANDMLTVAINLLPGNEKLKKGKMLLDNSMPQSVLTVCPPYETRGCAVANVKMGGQTYTNAFRMDGGYSDGYGPYAYFNLEGKYDTLEFDAGHIDESSMDEVTIEIILDGISSQIIEIKSGDLPQHFVVPLNGANQLKMSFSYTFGEWGIANAVLYPDTNSSMETVELASNTFLATVCPPYETRGCAIANVKMGGQTYTNAFQMDGGYSDGYGPYAYFNLEGKYDTLEFDAGHIDESSMDEVTIEIILDGISSQIIEIKSGDLPQHFVVPLNGANQLKMSFSYTFGEWGIANAVLY